jgi:hypothetical protein
MTASVNDVLQGIHLVRATTQIEFLAFCHTIESWLSEHDKVGQTSSNRTQDPPTDSGSTTSFVGPAGRHRHIVLPLQTAKHRSQPETPVDGLVSLFPDLATYSPPHLLNIRAFR